MTEKREIRKYTFTVEGETEKWYFQWLQKSINAIPESKYTVVIDAKVEQSPKKFAKKVNPLSVPNAVHVCDYESNSDTHVKKFQRIIDEIRDANKLKGCSFKYELRYSNFTFELWMILHKVDCNGILTDRTQYLQPINRAYSESFESLDKYKEEKGFAKCLSKLTLDDVKSAIRRSDRLMSLKESRGIDPQEYKGFRYYKDNPALTIWEPVKRILSDCNLL